MDVKKFSGLMIAAGLAVPVIMIAPPGLLALIEVGLIGALYVLRRRRQPAMPAGMQQELLRAASVRSIAGRPLRSPSARAASRPARPVRGDRQRAA